MALATAVLMGQAILVSLQWVLSCPHSLGAGVWSPSTTQ